MIPLLSDDIGWTERKLLFNKWKARHCTAAWQPSSNIWCWTWKHHEKKPVYKSPRYPKIFPENWKYSRPKAFSQSKKLKATRAKFWPKHMMGRKQIREGEQGDDLENIHCYTTNDQPSSSLHLFFMCSHLFPNQQWWTELEEIMETLTEFVGKKDLLGHRI